MILFEPDYLRFQEMWLLLIKDEALLRTVFIFDVIELKLLLKTLFDLYMNYIFISL